MVKETIGLEDVTLEINGKIVGGAQSAEVKWEQDIYQWCI